MSDASPVLLQAIAYLETQERDIIFRWVQVASRLPAHLRRPDEDLKTLIDHMPRILAALRRLMLEPVDPVMPMAIPEDLAVLHAVGRYRQRISARTVVKEYQLLRREMWTALQHWPHAEHLSAMDCFLLEERLNYPLDEYIAVSLETFVTLETEGGDAGAAALDNLGGR